MRKNTHTVFDSDLIFRTLRQGPALAVDTLLSSLATAGHETFNVSKEGASEITGGYLSGVLKKRDPTIWCLHLYWGPCYRGSYSYVGVYIGGL